MSASNLVPVDPSRHGDRAQHELRAIPNHLTKVPQHQQRHRERSSPTQHWLPSFHYQLHAVRRMSEERKRALRGATPAREPLLYTCLQPRNGEGNRYRIPRCEMRRSAHMKSCTQPNRPPYGTPERPEIGSGCRHPSARKQAPTRYHEEQGVGRNKYRSPSRRRYSSSCGKKKIDSRRQILISEGNFQKWAHGCPVMQFFGTPMCHRCMCWTPAMHEIVHVTTRVVHYH